MQKRRKRVRGGGGTVPSAGTVSTATIEADVEKFIANLFSQIPPDIRASGSGSGSRPRTFTLTWRGSQVAGTLKSFTLTQHCILRRVTTTNTGACSISRSPTAYPGSSAGFVLTFIGLAGAQNAGIGPLECYEEFEPNALIYFDSSGGLGTADAICFLFDLIPDVSTT